MIRALLSEADRLGVSKLTWRATRSGWTCRASAADPDPVVYEGRGRNGREALLHVVSFLRQVSQ